MLGGASVVGRRWALQPAGCWFDSRYRQNSQPGGLTTKGKRSGVPSRPTPNPAPLEDRPGTVELNQAPAQPLNCELPTQRRLETQPTRCNGVDARSRPTPNPAPLEDRPGTVELNQAPAQPLNCELPTQRRLETQPTRCNGVDARPGSYGWVPVLGPQGVECQRRVQT